MAVWPPSTESSIDDTLPTLLIPAIRIGNERIGLILERKVTAIGQLLCVMEHYIKLYKNSGIIKFKVCP